MAIANQQSPPVQTSVEIKGTPTIEGRLVRAEDLPAVNAQALDSWKSLAQRLTGQFSIIVKAPGASVAVTDLTGSWPVFLNESLPGGGFGETLHSVTSGRQLSLSTQGVARYLAFGNVGGACSLAGGVRTLPGASVSIMEGAEVKTSGWFDWGAAVTQDHRPVEDLDKEFRDLVRAWAEAEIPKVGRIALLLSGGTDSGMLAALLKPLLGDRLVCITQDFFLSRYSEKKGAAETAALLKIPLLVAHIGRKDYCKAFRELNSNTQDTAVWATEAHNLQCLAKFAIKKGCRTLITGYGADYLFLGQGHYFRGFPKARPEYLEAISHLTPEEKLKWVVPSPAQLSDLSIELLAALGISSSDYAHWVDQYVAWRLGQLEKLAAVVDLPKLQQISCQIDGGVEWQGEQGCLAAMRAVPECTVICPFYDAAVIRFALKLPPDLIYRDGQTKYFLRRVFKADTGLTRVKSHASLSPLRYWRFAPSAKEYVSVAQSLRGVYRQSLLRNLMKSGALYQPLSKLAALGVWMKSNHVSPPEKL